MLSGALGTPWGLFLGGTFFSQTPAGAAKSWFNVRQHPFSQPFPPGGRCLAAGELQRLPHLTLAGGAHPAEQLHGWYLGVGYCGKCVGFHIDLYGFL